MSACSTGCTKGGCNKMDVSNWFSQISYDPTSEEYNVVEVTFHHGTHKEFYINDKRLDLAKGEYICVEETTGFDIGQVSLQGELVKWQMKKKNIDVKKTPLQKILRKASPEELEKLEYLISKENEAMIKARLIARELNLDMKISAVEYQADGKKATFYFIADKRIDFRELIKRYINEFKVRIEMKHIGARQEAGRIGGIGSCGRELCCSTWLNEFPSVSTHAARYQDLAINIEKLSGQCGRLKCCLNYELNQYLEAFQDYPKQINYIETQEGVAVLRKKDILKRQLTYVYKDNPLSEYYKLNLSDVKNILELNKKGQKPESLSNIAIREVVEEKHKDEDLIGHVQLVNLEKSNNKNNKKRSKNWKNKRPNKKKDNP